ncbi:MAG: MtsA protein, partial [Deltaproteobacteria bacterium]|nr:MtsA protein [Deltaproteobacteria bacterium]
LALAGDALAPLGGGPATVASEGGPEVSFTLVDDLGFPDLVALAVHGGKAYAVSQTTDTLFAIDLESGRVEASTVGDGPRAVAVLDDGTIVIGYANERGLSVVRPHGLSRLDGPRGTFAIAAHGRTIFAAGQVDDDLWAVDADTGRTIGVARVLPNPRALAVSKDRVAVGSEQVGQVEIFDHALKRAGDPVAPTKRTQILSGRTEGYAAYVMGGKAVRGLAFATDRWFVSSIGPNVGPNPQRLEVTHDAGVGIIDAGRYVRHVGLGAGVTQGLASDGAHLYAADIGTGRIHVFDVRALTSDDAAAKKALVASLAIPPPPGFPLVRPDLNAANRSGPEVHSGPHALALANGSLYVLNRFTGTLAEIDTKTLALKRQIPVVDTLAKDRERRLGQVLFYGDLARSGMSCDSCHPDGHMDGVFFEKTRPLRVYKATTVRESASTPPYFVPTSTKSIKETCDFVGNRNRLLRLPMTRGEIDALASFSAALALPPNPDVSAGERKLPDGHIGDPKRGRAVFHGKGACASCHPPPLFTLDQDASTRGRAFDVGTPRAFPLRAHMQDTSIDRFPPPSLRGAWDVFPMLTSGAAGLGVDQDEQLFVRERFVLRDALEHFGAGKHGGYATLDARERDDLLAYVLSL